MGLESEEYFLKLADLYWQNKDAGNAITEYKKMMKKYPQNFLPYYKTGNIFFKLNNLDSALTYYNSALQMDDKQPFVLTKLYELYAKKNNVQKAIEFATEAFTSNIILLNAEQKIMIAQLKGTDNLLGLMDKIDLTREDRLKKYRRNIEEVNNYLLSNLSKDKYLFEINSLINKYPTSMILYYYKGIFYENKKDYQTAEKLYSRVLSVSTRNVRAHKRLGVLYEKMGKYKKAIKSFKRVLSLNNKDHTAYKSLIKLYRKTGNLNELCNEWLKIHFTQPGNKVLREFLIVALHKADRKQEAAKIIKESEKNE